MTTQTMPMPRQSGSENRWQDDPLTARARTVWTSGDFHQIATSFKDGAREFVDRLGISPLDTVLDVACGTGNLAIPAAQTGAQVVGVDLASNLIAQARLDARGMSNIEFDLGNAEALPYANRRFDITMSMFGAMFAYRPERAAAQLVRVTKRGGRIAMANWTPEGFAGKMLKAHAAVAPLPPGVPSPLRWGEDISVRAFLGAGAGKMRSVQCTRRTLELRFPFPPAQVTEAFASYYGPTVMALRNAEPAAAARLKAELTRLFLEHNVAQDGSTVVMSEYLDVLAEVA